MWHNVLKMRVFGKDYKYDAENKALAAGGEHPHDSRSMWKEGSESAFKGI